MNVNLAALQRVFKTLADPTRMRLLALLEQEELAVQDLMKVLDMAQSTVSRHLGILREAGLLRDRREGSWVYYRLAGQGRKEWDEVWALVKRCLSNDPTAARDRTALQSVLEARARRTRTWFDSIGPEWDTLRRVFHDDTQRARAIAKLVAPGLRVADIGTGTGILAQELARAGMQVIAIDHSRKMLEAARANLDSRSVDGVELRHGEANSLPLADGDVDAAFAHMVLHYVPAPAEVVGEMARIVRAGGKVVVVDFVAHDRTWMKEQLGVLWLGFALEQVRAWFTQAGLDDVAIEVNEVPETHNDLPATFIATGRKPTSTNGKT